MQPPLDELAMSNCDTTPTTTTTIESLPKEILLHILRQLPLQDLIHLECLNHRWRALSELLCHEARSLTLFGVSSVLNSCQNQNQNNSSSIVTLLRKCHQRYRVRLGPSNTHLTLASCSKQKLGKIPVNNNNNNTNPFATLTRPPRPPIKPKPASLSPTMVELLLRKLPNITTLQVVQLCPRGHNLDQLLYLLNGWSLRSFTFIQDDPISFFIQRSSSENSWRNVANQQPKSNNNSHLHRLLAHLSPEWQPMLRSLTLVTLDDLSKRAPGLRLNLSQLETLHLIRPWDLNRLTAQILLDSFSSNSNSLSNCPTNFNSNGSWFSSLTTLTLHSDSALTSSFIRDKAITPPLRELFRQLREFSVNFTNRTILCLIGQSCGQLRSLSLNAVSMPLIELLEELEPLQFQLQNLSIAYPPAGLPVSVEWKQPSDRVELVRFPLLRKLRLSHSSMMHSAEFAAPLLEHLFPRLEVLVLDRSSNISNSLEFGFDNGISNCQRCAREAPRAAFGCKYRLTQSLALAFDGLLEVRVQVEIEVEDDHEWNGANFENQKLFPSGFVNNTSRVDVNNNTNINSLKFHNNFKKNKTSQIVLEQYEVYRYKQRAWSLEQVAL